MVQFFFGILRTKSEPIGEEKSEQEPRGDEWFPTLTEQSFYDYNNFTNFWTVTNITFISSLANVSFQVKIQVKYSSEYSSENGLNIFFVLVEEIRGPLKIQGHWPEWRPSTEVNF